MQKERIRNTFVASEPRDYQSSLSRQINDRQMIESLSDVSRTLSSLKSRYRRSPP